MPACEKLESRRSTNTAMWLNAVTGAWQRRLITPAPPVRCVKQAGQFWLQVLKARDPAKTGTDIPNKSRTRRSPVTPNEG